MLIDEAGVVCNGFWIESESDNEQCPLREVSPITNPFGPGSVLTDLVERLSSVAGGDTVTAAASSQGSSSAAAGLIEAKLVALQETGGKEGTDALGAQLASLENELKGEDLEQLRTFEKQVRPLRGLPYRRASLDSKGHPATVACHALSRHHAHICRSRISRAR